MFLHSEMLSRLGKSHSVLWKRSYWKGKTPSFSDIRKVVPNISFESIRKRVIDNIEPPSIPEWYSGIQKRFLNDWDTVVRNITWRESDFEADNIVKLDPLLVIAKAIVEFGSLASKTKTTTHLLPITVGLYMVMKRQPLGIEQEIIEHEISDAKLSYWIYHHAEMARAPYVSTRRAYFLNKTFIRPECIISSRASETCRPGYILARNDLTKEIILSFCGTSSTADLLLDITASNVKFMSGKTHRGALIAARWCLDHLEDKIEKQFQQYPDYHLKLIGHSLGGAIAVLFTCMLQDRYPINTVTFGAPPVCSKELAEAVHQPITNVILDGDLIPQISLHSFCRLENQLISSNWKEDLTKEVNSVEQKFLRDALSGVVAGLVGDKKEVPKIEGEKPVSNEVMDVIAKEVDKHQGEAKEIISSELEQNLEEEPMMYHPGTIIQIYPVNPQKKSYARGEFKLRKLNPDKFANKPLHLSESMLSDHAMRHYLPALWSAIKYSHNSHELVPKFLYPNKHPSLDSPN